MSSGGQDQVGGKVYLLRVETVVTLAQKRDLDVAGRRLLDQHPPNPAELDILPKRLLLEVLLGNVAKCKMTGLLLKLNDIDLTLQYLYLLLQLFILLEHLTRPLLVILDLVLEIQDLSVDVLGADEIGIHLDDILRFLLDLLDLRVRDLYDLLFMDGHPRLEQLIKVVDVATKRSEIVENGLVQLYFRWFFWPDWRGLVPLVEEQMLELSLAIAREIGFSEVDEGILIDCGHPVLWTILLQFYYTPIKPTRWVSLPMIIFESLETSQNRLAIISIRFLDQILLLVLYINMSKFYTTIGHFLIGFSDSVSPRWIADVLFYTDRTTKKILPQSLQLQKALLRSLVQAGLITTLLPIIVRWLGFVILGWILTGLSLIFTYSYLIFYNMDVTDKAMKVIIWKTQQHPTSMPELDKRYKYNPFVEMSYLIQSFIFEMVYYTPMNLLLIIITLFDEKYFPVLLVIMDSFFNACFYYFRKWPYDNFNVAFLEKHLSYCLGYGFFVSVVTNVMLPPSMSIGGYLLISQWMIINALYHTPPHKTFSSFAEIYSVLVNREERRRLPSAYNIHRQKLKEREYRRQIMKDCVFMISFFRLTERINLFLNQRILNRPVAQPLAESRYEPSAETEASKISVPTEEDSRASGQSVLEEKSEEFFDARSEETTIFNLEFGNSSDGGESQKEK